MSDARQKILAVNDAFYRAFEKKDIEAMRAVWSQGTGSSCIHPGRPALKGWSAVQLTWEKIFKTTAYLEIDLEIISLEVSDALAYVVLLENVLQMAGGRKNQVQTIATNVFERLGTEWYLVHHHGSFLPR